MCKTVKVDLRHVKTKKSNLTGTNLALECSTTYHTQSLKLSRWIVISVYTRHFLLINWLFSSGLSQTKSSIAAKKKKKKKENMWIVSVVFGSLGQNRPSRAEQSCHKGVKTLIFTGAQTAQTPDFMWNQLNAYVNNAHVTCKLFFLQNHNEYFMIGQINKNKKRKLYQSNLAITYRHQHWC